MGNSEAPYNRIQQDVQQIRKAIPSDRYFEFGDHPEVIGAIESGVARLRHSLEDEMNATGDSSSLRELNPYFAAIRTVSGIQEFIKAVRKSGTGSTENTRKLREYVDRLEEQTSALGHAVGESPIAVKPQRKDEASSPSPKTKSIQRAASAPSPGQETPIPSSGPEPAKPASIRTRLMAIPPAIGDFVFDTIGRKDIKPASSIIMGWIATFIIALLFILILLALTRVLDINPLVDFFKGIYRFFHPLPTAAP